MSVDLGSMQFKVEADTTSLDKANADVDGLAKHATQAGTAVDNLGDQATKSAKKIETVSQGTAKATDGMSKMRSVAQSAGYQLQDVAVQAQMGTSAFTILGQQGSQFASAFGPTGAVVGAVLAVGAALGGVLFKSLMQTSKAMEEVGDNAKIMAKNIRDLTDAEREHLKLASADATNKQIKEANELSETIKKQTESIRKLNEENGKTKVSVSNTPGGGAVVYTETINNTKELQLQQEKLNATTIKFDAINKQIESDRDLEGARKTIQSIKDQADLIGLHGDALWKLKGIQAGLTDENLKAYMVEAKRFDAATTAQRIKALNDETLALDLKNAEIHKNIGLISQLSDQIAKSKASEQGGSPEQQAQIIAAEKLNTAKREQNALDQQAQTLYDSQDKAAKNKIASMEREIVLFGDTSKAAQLEYDIKTGLMKVNGGIESQQAQQILNLSKIIGLLEVMDTLAKSQRDVDLSAMGENGKLASVQLEYDIKKGIVKLNNDIDGQEAGILIANKKQVEANERVFNIDEMIKKQKEDIAMYYSDGSKAAQLEYEIRNGILKVEGGINSAQAQQLINNQKTIDMQSRIKTTTQLTVDSLERINAAGADMWVGIAEGGKNAFDGIKKIFLQTLGEMAHAAITKPIILKIESSMMGGGGSNAGAAGSAIGAGGWYAAAALVFAGAISEANKQQAKKFDEMKAAYRQANQSIGTLLGEANSKSESISKSLDELQKYSSDSLNVNQGMLSELIEIKTNLAGVAAGFAKQFQITGIANANKVKTGSSTLGFNNWVLKTGQKSVGGLLLDNKTTEFIRGIGNAVTNKISKAIYNKKISITDTGIQIAGQTLADIMEKGVTGAFSYADVRTTKKFLGMNISDKVKTQTTALDSIITDQFADVFKGAGNILKDASGQFGVDFDKYVNQLKVDPKKLSLKGLEGDALEKEIEKFFSSTLDNWASVLLKGTDILTNYQQIGEGAFETFVRLASETRSVMGYVDDLGLNLHATGIAAVDAVQGISSAIGGFDSLTSALNTYSSKFLSDADRFEDLQKKAGAYLGELGVALPQTREQFKAIVQAIDLTTEAGQKQFAALIKVSGAVDDYITQLEKQRKVLVDASYGGLTRAVDAQKKIINAQMTAVNASLTAAQAVYSALSSTLNGMVIDSKQTEAITRRQAQNQLQDALTGAKNGILPNLDKLTGALATVAKPSESLYKTFQDYAEDFYKTADTIKQLQDAAGSQVSVEQQSLDQLQKQSDDLDNMLVWAKMQVDVLNGIDVSVLSVASALSAFGNALGIDTSGVMAMAAASNGTAGGTPAQQAAQQLAQKAADDQAVKDKENQAFMRASQLAIADFTNKTYKILDKFDTIGMPPVRDDA